MTGRAKSRINKGRILLLEDHAALAVLRRDFLAGQGYQVVCSASGEDARRLLESQPFQLVVADALLAPAERYADEGAKREAGRGNGTGWRGTSPVAPPVISPAPFPALPPALSPALPPAMSGWEVAAVAKQRGVPVILSSGWPVRLGALELRKLGVGYLCPKPCSLHQLLYVVENALEAARAASNAPPASLPGTKGSVPKPRPKK